MLLHHIFQKFGSDLFREASSHALYSTRLSFLTNRLSKSPTKYQDQAIFASMYRQYTSLSVASKSRYQLLLSNPWDTLEEFGGVGCRNVDCPTKSNLKEFMEPFRPEDRRNDPAIDRKLEKWRKKLKICDRCKVAIYCSRQCQKADWPHHKEDCTRQDIRPHLTIENSSQVCRGEGGQEETSTAFISEAASEGRDDKPATPPSAIER